MREQGGKDKNRRDWRQKREKTKNIRGQNDKKRNTRIRRNWRIRESKERER